MFNRKLRVAGCAFGEGEKIEGESSWQSVGKFHDDTPSYGLIRNSLDSDRLLNVEYLAEARHVEHVFHQWLEVSDNQFASLLCKHFIQTKEYA